MPVFGGRYHFNCNMALFVLLYVIVTLLLKSVDEPVLNKHGEATKISSNTLFTEIHDATMLNDTPEDDIINIYTNEGAEKCEISEIPANVDLKPNDSIDGARISNEGDEKDKISRIPANADLKPCEDNIFKAGNIKERSVIYTDSQPQAKNGNKDDIVPDNTDSNEKANEVKVQSYPFRYKLYNSYRGLVDFLLNLFEVLVLMMLLVFNHVLNNIPRVRM